MSEMRDISKSDLNLVQEGNIGGLTKSIRIILIDDIEFFPQVIDGHIEFAIIPKEGKRLARWYTTKHSGEVQCELVGPEGGKVFRNSLQFEVPKSSTLITDIPLLQNNRFIAIGKDQNGVSRIIGTMERPARIKKISSSTGRQGTDKNNYSFQLEAYNEYEAFTYGDKEFPVPLFVFKTQKIGNVNISVTGGSGWYFTTATGEEISNTSTLNWVRNEADTDTIYLYNSNGLGLSSITALTANNNIHFGDYDFSTFTNLKTFNWVGNGQDSVVFADNSFKLEGDTIDVTNSFFTGAQFGALLAEIRRVSDTQSVVNRSLKVGTIEDPAFIEVGSIYYDDYVYLQSIGWSINVVSNKLLTATIGASGFISPGGVITGDGQLMYRVNGDIVSNVNSGGEVVEFEIKTNDLLECWYANTTNDLLGLSIILMNSCSIEKFIPQQLLQESSITIELNFNQVISSQILQEVTTVSGGMTIEKFDFFEEFNDTNFNNCIQLYEDSGISILLPYAEIENDDDYNDNKSNYYRAFGRVPYPYFINDSDQIIRYSNDNKSTAISSNKIRLLVKDYDILNTVTWVQFGVSNIPVKNLKIVQYLINASSGTTTVYLSSRMQSDKLLQLNSDAVYLYYKPTNIVLPTLPDFSGNNFNKLYFSGGDINFLQNHLPVNIERVQNALMWASGKPMTLGTTYNSLKYLTHSNFTINRGKFSSGLTITADQPSLEEIDANLVVQPNVNLSSLKLFPKNADNLASSLRLELSSTDNGNVNIQNSILEYMHITYKRSLGVNYGFNLPTTLKNIRLKEVSNLYEHNIEFLKHPNIEYAYFSSINTGAYSMNTHVDFIQNVINDASQNTSQIIKKLYVWDGSDGWIGVRQPASSFQPYNTDFSSLTAKNWAVYFVPNDTVDPSNLGFAPWTVLNYVRRDPSGREFWKYTTRSLNTTIDGVLITKIWREKGTTNFTDEEPEITI
ncbi:hypothetical protein [Flammeovirga aprica]|uniref:Uncharacterized protein n=1 Tax=Flammeovirga aprica JL-4 TaxID=694437 RepID=A0A7X9P0B1_9BACT|nr:hypothetical protein [Flammeovirga aprica]NME67206.1 hypothetical protein [Flammeovirga aprica JL-4]